MYFMHWIAIESFLEHNYSCTEKYKQFTNLRNNGDLIFTSKCTFFKIINEAEMYFLVLTETLKYLSIQNLDLKITYFCNKTFSLVKKCFANLSYSGYLLDRSHKMILISLLVKKYLSIRLHSSEKMFSTEILNTVTHRQKLTKQIIFMNQ